VSTTGDDTYGAAGWRRIADKWLQPGSRDLEHFSTCYRLLYSRSQYVDSPAG
jgi:hypothetical protein